MGDVQSELLVRAVVGDGEQITDWYAAKSAFLAVLAVSAVAQEQSVKWPGQSLGWFGFQIPLIPNVANILLNSQ